MAERTELEKRVRRLISSDISYRVLKSLGEKGVRRLTKVATEIVDLLDKEEVNERFFAYLEESEEEKSRTLREGIYLFKIENPRYGDILEGMIAQKRVQRNKNLVYGLNPGYKLSEEDYIHVIMDLGFERREASAIYPHLLRISESLKKANEQEKRTILIGDE